MHMRNLERRVHLLLDEERYRKLEVEAKHRHVSVAAVIRDAIDRMPSDADRRRRAIEFVLAAPPTPVPDDPRELRRELDEAHDRVPR
jgi:hypothetical protein